METTIYDKIYLTAELGEITWCADRLNKNDTEYVIKYKLNRLESQLSDRDNQLELAKIDLDTEKVKVSGRDLNFKALQTQLQDRDKLLGECFTFIKNTPHLTGPKEQVDLLNKLLPICRGAKLTKVED